MAFLVSAMSVFTFASDGEVTEEEENPVTVIFNRGFDDGWDWLNGATLAASGHDVSLGEEPTATGVNHYLDLATATDYGNCYWQITTTGVVGATESVVEFDMRSDGMTRPGALTILYPRIGGVSSNDVTTIQRTATGAINFTWGVTKQISPTTPENWLHIALKFIANPDAGTITCICYADGEYIGEGTKTFTTGLDISFLRFQANANQTCGIGDNLCLDNVKYYAGTSEIIELDSKDYGAAVDTTKNKTVLLEGTQTGDEAVSVAELLDKAYIMKVGTKRALKSGERVNIFDGPLGGEYGNPQVIDGVIYLPLMPLLEHMGASYSMAGSSSIDVAIAAKDPETGAVTTGVSTIYMGRDEALVAREIVKLTGAPGVVRTGLYYTDDDGEEIEATYMAIAMDDVEKVFPGWYITYDAMGLIILSTVDDIINRDTALDTMIALMNEFVYDDPKADQILEDFREATNNFDHPYLLGNEEDFDFLRSVYNKEYLNEDGTANEEFLAECGLTLEQMQLLAQRIREYVVKGVAAYIAYIIPDDYVVDGNPHYFTTGDGSIRSLAHEKMLDADGNFIYPYDDSVRGAGKIVFAPNFTTKGGGGTWDLIVDDYVIANAISSSVPKKNYVYNPETDSYDQVPEGTGVFDYIVYNFVDLKAPEKNYVLNTETGEYTEVAKGSGTHDVVGYDAQGKPIYQVLRTPLNNYRRRASNRVSDSSQYNFAYGFTPYMNFYTDPSDPETYLELNDTTCQLCHLDHFGYDCEGARLNGGPNPNNAQYLAFAYQMTGQLDYARLAYDLLDIQGSWAHWGPAHALNFAEASYAYAIALDWIYDAVVEMSANGETNYKGEPMDIKVLQQHLWEHGSGEDYVMAVMGSADRNNKTHYLRDNTDNPGIIADTSSYYVDDKNNWGNVVNANTAVAAICLLDYTDTLTADTNFSKVYLGDGRNIPIGETYQSLCLEILEIKLWCLHYYAAWSYVPDGVYTEAPGYWAYGTNAIMHLINVLHNTVGHSYTLMDAPGYDKTFIYAANMETKLDPGGKFVNFNYNDGSIGNTDTSFFITAAFALNQPELIVLRFEQYNSGYSGKLPQLHELFLFTDAVKFLNDSGVEDAELDLDYFGKTFELFVTRSSWDDEKPLFAGISAGPSSLNHGHLDNGSWVFYDEGHVWITDPGSESYNVYKDTDYPSPGDWNSTTKTMNLRFRYRYYRLSSEGHNTLILTGHQDTLPYGQNAQTTTNSPSIEIGDTGEYYYSDENGSFVMFDMQPIYKSVSGTQYTNYARRGMLLTNGRNTLVIQDEVEFANMEYYAWCAHAMLSGGYYPDSYKISNDGKTLYLTTAEDDAVCRLSIVMEYEDGRFAWEHRLTNPTIGNTEGVYLLNSTLPIDSYLEYGNDTQYNRDTLRNFVITPRRNGELTTTRSLNMAVVVEAFGSMAEAETAPVAYEFTPMEQWETYGVEKFSGVQTSPDTEMRDQPTSKDLEKLIEYAGGIESDLGLFKLYEVPFIYSSLTESRFIITGLGGANSFSDEYKEPAIYLNGIIARYEAYVTQMNKKLDNVASIVDNLT